MGEPGQLGSLKFYTMKSLLILLTLSAILMYFGYQAIEEKYYDCRVIDKMTTAAGYKVQAKWVLVLQTDEKMFDIKVSPTTYSQCKVGDLLVFKLSYEDFNPGGWGTLPFILGLFCLAGAGISLLALILQRYFNS